MAKNLSKLAGTPSTRSDGIAQHKMLTKNLRGNKVFFLPSQNRGYLVLKAEIVKLYGNKKITVWHNYLQDTKPTGKFIKVTKV
jgi:hypothetical protein